MKYKVRDLNILDVRWMAKILKEVNLTKDEFKDLVADIMVSARSISSSEESSDDAENENPKPSSRYNGFVSAIVPAIGIIIDLLSGSDSFWEFLADLLSTDYEGLRQVKLNDMKEIYGTLAENEQVISFFTSISDVMKSEEKPKSSITLCEDTVI